MKVWISRDRKCGSSDTHVVIRRSEPTVTKYTDGGSFFFGVVGQNSGRCTVTAKNFKQVLGFTPRKGTCKEYELTLKASE